MLRHNIDRIKFMKFTFYIFFCLVILFPTIGYSQEASIGGSAPVAAASAPNKPGLGIGAIPVRPYNPQGDTVPNNVPMPINPAAPAGQQVPIAGQPPVPTDAEVVKPYIVFNGVSAKTLNTNVKSIMFDRAALPKYYQRVLSLKKDTKDLSPIAGQALPEDDENTPKSIVAPSFFLSSILLPEDGNWSVWVNKGKIRNYLPKADKLEIVSVSKTQIEAKFQDQYLYKMSPFIQTKLKQTTNDTDWDYASEKGDVKVNLMKGLVQFKIKQNQSFSTYDMEVFEGFVDSKTVSFDPNNPDAAGQAVSGVGSTDLILGGAEGAADPAVPGAVVDPSAQPQAVPVQPNP